MVYLLGCLFLEDFSLRFTAPFFDVVRLKWQLSTGLSLACMMVFGIRYAPLVFIGSLLAHIHVFPTSVAAVLALNTAVGCSLGLMVLRHDVQADLNLRRARDMAWFMLITVVLTLVVPACAIVQVRILGIELPGFLTDAIFTSRNLDVWLAFWVRDAIGIIALTPFLLVCALPLSRWLHVIWKNRLQTPFNMRKGITACWRPALEIALIVVIFSAALQAPRFLGMERTAPIVHHFLYLSFLPLIFVSLRHGLRGTTACILFLNLAAMAIAQRQGDSPDGKLLLHMQFLMLALSLTGLFLGAVVTERRRVQTQLTDILQQLTDALKRRKELEDIVKQGPMVVYQWRAAEGWPVEFVSENIRQFGYEAAAFRTGKLKFQDLVFSEDRDRVGTEMAKLSQDGIPIYSKNYRILTKRGDVRWVDDRMWKCHDEHTGLLTHYQGVLIDITEKKWAEDKLHRSEERFRLLLNGVRDYAIFMLSIHGKVVSWNEGAERITGYTESEILGQNVARFYGTEELRDDLPSQHLGATIRDGGNEAEGWRVRKDGSRFWANMILTPLHEDSGKVRGFSCVIRDITEKRAAQDALLRAKEAAEAASRAKSEFLATVSHEIRTPVNEVIGMTGLLLDTELAPQQRECASAVRRSSEILRGQLNAILDLAQLESDSLSLEPSTFDLVSALEEVVEMHKPLAAIQDVTFTVQVSSDAPRGFVADAGRIRQVLGSLVDNAVKFCRGAAVMISAECLERTSDAALIRLSVQDNGPGIPEEKQAEIFEKFTQLDPHARKQHGGLGLGLTIAKRLVNLMGGTMGVVSQPGRGSTFWFGLRLPLANQAPVPAAVLADDGKPYDPATRYRILLAEDNIADQATLTRMLERLGCRVDVAANGGEAVELFSKLPYDLVFMDVHMPHMDGFEATRRLRKGPATGHQVPIVGMTGSPTPETLQQCEETGMKECLTKPVSARALAATLARLKPSSAV